MDLIFNIILFIGSLAVLLKASDWFIDSAERIGLSLGISPFLVGVTIVAFGTSLPELAASIASVSANESEVVISNVVGSNITNIALVLGLTVVIIKKIELENNIWHIDMPYLWASAFLFFLVTLDGDFSVGEAVLFLGGIVIFLGYTMQSNVPPTKDARPEATWRHYGLLLLGGVLVWIGAKFTIDGIVGLSEHAGISSELISLFAVALGTSLPEIIVSLNAGRKGKASIAVGNVMGSNIFNTYIVMSIPRFIGPLEISSKMTSFYIPLMVVMTIMFGIITNDRKISRWEGMALLLFYGLFVLEIVSEVV